MKLLKLCEQVNMKLWLLLIAIQDFTEVVVCPKFPSELTLMWLQKRVVFNQIIFIIVKNLSQTEV